jgi:hypothetical protein
MGNKKALDSHWHERVSKDAANLEEILKKEIAVRGEPFKNITRAAEFGAKKLTDMSPEKQAPVAVSTLTRRNSAYRAILEEYSKKDGHQEVTGSERTKFRLEIKKRNNEIERLDKQLTTALEDRSKSQYRLGQSVSHDASQKAVEASFVIWKKVIYRLLKELKGAEFDLQKRTIEDEFGVGTLLEEEDFPEGFFDWLKRNSK